MTTWYHGTSEMKYHKILHSWFEPNEGTWGKGIYFSSSKEGALIFGEYLLRVVIPDEHIHFINYKQWIVENPNEEKWPQEISKLNHVAVAIRYETGEVELCVIDPKVIQQIF